MAATHFWFSLPNWTFVFARDFNWLDQALYLPTNATVLSCQIHEGIMYSASRLHVNGDRVWSLKYFAEETGGQQIAIDGDPPRQTFTIFNSAKTRQKSRATALKANFIFDVPIAVAASLIGFRHDAAPPGIRYFAAEES